MIDLEHLGWDETALPVAWRSLAEALDLTTPTAATSPPRRKALETSADTWVTDAAESAGLQAQALQCSHAELAQVLASCAPALLRIEVGAGHRYLSVVRSSTKHLVILTPQLVERRVRLTAVLQELACELERSVSSAVDSWLARARVSRFHSLRTRRAMLATLLSDRRVSGLWVLELDPGSPLSQQLRVSGARRRVLAAIGCGVAQVTLNAAGWFVLARGALTGVFEAGWLLAWWLACLSAALCEVGALWFGGGALTDAAMLIKRRLFTGALRAPADYIHSQGPGRLLGLVAEADSIESAGLRGTFAAGVAFLQLLGSLPLLCLGAGGYLQVGILLAVCGYVALASVHYFRARDRWATLRIALAQDFVENVVGQRTRVAQQPRERWHEREDGQLCEYQLAARDMDAAQQRLVSVPARSFFLLALLGLAPALLLSGSDPAAVALAVGGTLQAYSALAVLGFCIVPLSAAASGWGRIRPLYSAAISTTRTRPLTVASTAHPPQPTLEARALWFRHPRSSKPTLQDCSLELRYGQRVLLEASSGAGKTTLVSLLLGLQRPDAGHVLLGGVDPSSVSLQAWRRRIASAPQFNQNHIFNASLAFNLLLGRGWPASEADRNEAIAVCRELGLGPLLERMPSGLDQVVGESGWQLSHGERSRVFIARTVLQGAAISIMDESFGTLDAAALRTCLLALRARPGTLVVIAHV